MATSKFNKVWNGFLELIGDGLSFKDACRECEVQEKTVRNWLSKGRAGDERYVEFATIFEATKEEVEQRKEPMDREELLLVVSEAARKGSVQAMKLMEEMLRAKPDDPGEKPVDAFDALDGEGDGIASIAEARKRKRSA